MNNRILIILLLGTLAWFNRKTPLLGGSDNDELLVALLMSAFSLSPIILWVARGLKGVPTFELFCFGHFNYYVVPYLGATPVFMRMSSASISARAITGMLSSRARTTSGFENFTADEITTTSTSGATRSA